MQNYDMFYLSTSNTSPGSIITAGGDYYWNGLGIYISNDNGISWRDVTPLPGNPNWVGPVAADSNDPNVFYAYEDFSPVSPRVFKTSNSGLTWSQILSVWVSDIKVAPSNSNIVYAVGESLFVSVDGGTNWITRPLPITPELTELTVDPTNANTIYAGLNVLSTFKSTDGGQTWARMNGIPGSKIYIDPADANKLYAFSGGNQLLKSNDGGRNWFEIAAGSSYLTAFAVDWRTSTLYLGRWIKVERSTDGGQTWTNFSAGLANPYPDNYIYRLEYDAANKLLHAGALWGIYSITTVPRTSADFDGDGRADVSVYRPSSGSWFWLNSGSGGFHEMRFGLSSDLIVPGDYDADGQTDLVVFRPSEGNWYLNRSREGFGVVRWGMAGDIPIQGDFDGDEKADIVIYRPTTGTWWFDLRQPYGQFTISFGIEGDIPVAGDYDSDGISNMAVFRPSKGTWYVRRYDPVEGLIVVDSIRFGMAGDIPVPKDYDGDGSVDIAVFRPSTGEWWIRRSHDLSVVVARWGMQSDVPVPSDYDGDGRTDIAVYRSGVWYILESAHGSAAYSYFGLGSDLPVPK
jgi:photosystem II stability/assembly factor-like uncharacterized protein